MFVLPHTRIGDRWEGYPLVPDGSCEISGPYHATFDPWTVTVPHRGVDLRIGMGTRLYAACSGLVRQYTWGTFGWWTVIEHESGLNLVTAHMSEFAPGLAGERVEAGTWIGKSGGALGHPGSGRSSGAHCHVEVNAGKLIIPGLEQNPAIYAAWEDEVPQLTEDQIKRMCEDIVETKFKEMAGSIGGDIGAPGSFEELAEALVARINGINLAAEEAWNLPDISRSPELEKFLDRLVAATDLTNDWRTFRFVPEEV